MPMSCSTIPTAMTSVPPDDAEPDQERDREEQWHDGGDSWWAPHPVPPSYRDPQ